MSNYWRAFWSFFWGITLCLWVDLLWLPVGVAFYSGIEGVELAKYGIECAASFVCLSLVMAIVFVTGSVMDLDGKPRDLQLEALVRDGRYMLFRGNPIGWIIALVIWLLPRVAWIGLIVCILLLGMIKPEKKGA